MWERAIEHVTQLSAGEPVDQDLRVTLNFHPDRGAILESLRDQGVYRSQFETGTSNGGLGGRRKDWESRLFGGVYDDAPPSARPKYGALNFRRRPAGGAPRFGSAHFRLTSETLRRTTFCYPDSVFEPADFGTAERMSLIEKAQADEKDVLDDYVEAHVHGPVTLKTDVEALVLDPCYKGTPVERLAGELPCPVEWHHGFRAHVGDIDPEYRGAHIAELACSLARNGFLDARIIGEAVGKHDPQDLKKVWHCVAKFG
ncbi:hypothetical protein Lesp02_58230 [Lentzea sp. NBRC 105346]|uniref:DUF3626 domain-containing protein n=1 Tax=Lentzea sp. NBRC 105346 TaxID=3032205 RepID=UPI0024A4CB83|nr:DUF3626 domain-containing protein [Lentzea sp. NBRC 105346]GLZ33635.1 hypothetical protein Lesp02_58230 [Lentzea sp. NBRC 105346]